MQADLTDADFTRWPNFTRAELACKGNGECRMDPAFMDALQALRTKYGRPMAINSGYRSPAYNAQVSTTGEDGPHTMGKAVDVAVRGSDAHELMRLALEAGFTGIGVKQAGEGRFLHLDTLTPQDTPTRPWVWSYP